MHIAFGKNFKDTVPRCRDVSFSGFTKFVTERPRHVGTLSFNDYSMAGKLERGVDKDCAWFIPALFARPVRKSHAVVSISGFVCDFDSGAVSRQQIETTLREAGQFSFVAWSSYSHLVGGKERWRVFIPYASPCEPKDHHLVYEYFNDLFKGELDARCKTTSQLWYLPGSPADAPRSELFTVDTGTYCESANCRRREASHTAPGGDLVSSIPGTISGTLVSALATGARVNAELIGRGPTSLADIKSALAALPPAQYGEGEYTNWINIGMAIYDGTQGSPEGLDIFDAWSATLTGYSALDAPGGPRAKWYSFGGREGLSSITVATLFKQAKDAGWAPGDGGVSVQSPGNAVPHETPVSQVVAPQNLQVGNGTIQPPVLAALPVIVTAPVAMPVRFRNHPTAWGIQKVMEDPNSGAPMWTTCIGGLHVLGVEVLRTIGEGQHTVEIVAESASGVNSASFALGLVASSTELRTELLNNGILTMPHEFKELQDLIMEWLKKIQENQRIKQSFTHLGWMEKDTVALGFALGDTAYHADGRVEGGIKVANGIGGSSIGKHYLPQGNFKAWKGVADFLTSQGRVELMAILATSFGSPLMKFSGHSGAVVSIVSSASGVGKSTALSVAQSVWGSPKSAMHSASDTVLSLSSKMGFTKDLPAYWDDIKGEKTFAQFADTIYAITQGKEKSRLANTSHLMEVQNWNCLAVIAANDSIIEIVKKYGSKGTDAGAARIFEMRLEARPKSNQSATFFDACTTNYGHAGAIYGKWLAMNHDAAKALILRLSAKYAEELQVTAEERFWVAAMTTMLAGAMIAKKIGLVDFDIPALAAFLKTQFFLLRDGKVVQMKEQGPGPTISGMAYDYQQTTLRIEEMPFKNRPVTITRAPMHRDIEILLTDKERILRIRKAKFADWCKVHGQSHSNLVTQMLDLGVLTEKNADPMAGTSYSIGQRTACYDIDLKALNVEIEDEGTDSTGGDPPQV